MDAEELGQEGVLDELLNQLIYSNIIQSFNLLAIFDPEHLTDEVRRSIVLYVRDYLNGITLEDD